jgi:hypothetical protein
MKKVKVSVGNANKVARRVKNQTKSYANRIKRNL